MFVSFWVVKNWKIFLHNNRFFWIMCYLLNCQRILLSFSNSNGNSTTQMVTDNQILKICFPTQMVTDDTKFFIKIIDSSQWLFQIDGKKGTVQVPVFIWFCIWLTDGTESFLRLARLSVCFLLSSLHVSVSISSGDSSLFFGNLFFLQNTKQHLHFYGRIFSCQKNM